MVMHPKPNERYTYRDYLDWPDEERWELIDGTPYNMTPSPSTDHQRILGGLYRKISNFLDGRSFEAFLAPFDVRLFPDKKKRDDNIVQPDLTVVCDPSKITSKGCEGAPDLVIEILSPSTAKKDKGQKKRLYERAKVKEYWIVDPLNFTIEIFNLSEQGKYGEADLYGKEDEVGSILFDNLLIDLKSIFISEEERNPDEE